MSLAIVVYVPEGIVMSTDSRQSIKIEGQKPDGERFKVETINSDAVTKTLLLKEHKIGISYFGVAMLDGIPMSSHIRKFQEEKVMKSDDIASIPNKIVDYFHKSFLGADVGFHIAGYKKEGKLSIPYVWHCHVKREIVERRNFKDDKRIVYGATWSGAIDIIQSIINPVVIKGKVIRPTAPIAWDAMTTQDAIDFAIYGIRTTIDTMRFQARPKIVGGPIDVLLLAPNRDHAWIQKKEYHGESVL